MKSFISLIRGPALRWVGTIALGALLTTAPIGVFAQATSTDNGTGTTTDTTMSTTTDMDMGSTTSATSSSTPVTIMVMLHTCPSTVHTMTDFGNVENGSGSTTPSILSQFGMAEWACPTTGLTGDAAFAGSVSAPRSTFGFTVSDTNGHSKTLSDAMYMPSQICESTFNMDLNGDGTISPSTCLDAGSYSFTGLTGNAITVQMTDPSPGYHYGTTLFTPSALISNNDMDTFVSQTTNEGAGTGSVMLDVASSTNHNVMLHVFQFADMGTTTQNTAPMITLSGNSVMTLTQGSTFTDPGATATDAESGNLTSSIVVTGGPVNTNNVGTTTLTYMVTDPQGLSSSVTRTVIVNATNNTGGGENNNTAPMITLTGANPFFVTEGSTFTDPGATATDTESGNLTSSIVVTGGPVNTSMLGTTTLTYTVTDPQGLSASVTRTVIVNATGTNPGDNTGGTGTTTPGITDQGLSVFLNVIQRVEDIQAQILSLLDRVFTR